MKTAVRIAFAGSPGDVSPWLLRAMAQAEARFVGLFAAHTADAERAAEQFHARWPFHDLEAMLRDAQPHGVVIAALPPPLRAQALRACLAARVPALVAGVPDLPAGRQASRGAAFVWCTTALPHSPALALAQRLVQSGKLGGLMSVAVSVARPRISRHAADAAWPVGRDTLLEAVNLIEFLAGPLREVSARGHPDGAVAATLVSRGDVPVGLRCCEHGTPESAGAEIEVLGDDGVSLTVDRQMRLNCRGGTRVIESRTPALGVADPAVEYGYLGMINEFVARLADGRRRNAELDGLSAVRTVDALLTSLSRSSWVRLDRAASRARGAGVA